MVTLRKSTVRVYAGGDIVSYLFEMLCVIGAEAHGRLFVSNY